MGAKVNVDLDSFKWLYAEGLSDRKIGKILGFSRYTSAKIRSELGLAPNQLRKKTVFDLEGFKRLHAEGLNDREIGEALGFSRSVSARIRNELDLPPNFKPPEKIVVDFKKFKRLYAEGKKDEEIAKALGFSLKKAWDIRNEIGLPPQPRSLFSSKVNETEFLKHYQQGKSTKEIANELHVAHKFLYYWMRKHNYKVNRTKRAQKPITLPSQQQFERRKKNEERKEKHEKRLELYNKGLSDSQIAAELCEAKNVITRWRCKNKLLRPENPSDMKVVESLDTSFSLPSALLGKFNEIIKKRGYSTYSEAVRDAIKNYISDYEWIDDIKDRHAGTASIVYNYTKHGLLDALVDIQHNYSHLIRSSVHIYFDYDTRFEVVILDGDGEEIKELAKAMTALKGVKFSEPKTTSLAKRD